MIGHSYADLVSWIPILGGLNIDYLDIDEPLSTYGWTIPQLQYFVSSALALKPKLNFIINDCRICGNNPIDPIAQLYSLIVNCFRVRG
jgi:hypothetical protein